MYSINFINTIQFEKFAVTFGKTCSFSGFPTAAMFEFFSMQAFFYFLTEAICHYTYCSHFSAAILLQLYTYCSHFSAAILLQLFFQFHTAVFPFNFLTATPLSESTLLPQRCAFTSTSSDRVSLSRSLLRILT